MERSPREEGITPLKSLFDKFKYLRFDKLLKEAGRVSFNRFEEMSKYIRLIRLP